MLFNLKKWFILCCVYCLIKFADLTNALQQKQDQKSISSNPVQQSYPLGPSNRIVGGTSVDIKNYPYQLSLRYKGKHICGASILSERFAVTAAHCTNSLRINPSGISLRAGTSLLNQGGQLVNVKSIHQHPRFNLLEVDYDISILELSSKFSFNANVKNIGLVGGEPREGSQVTISGWGTAKEDASSLPSHLQATRIPIVGRPRCKLAYRKIGDVTDRMICAGLVRQGGRDSCQGDSGGPMTFNGKLAGIVSWGYGCGDPGYPGVYTNIANPEIRRFVKRITGI